MCQNVKQNVNMTYLRFCTKVLINYHCNSPTSTELNLLFSGGVKAESAHFSSDKHSVKSCSSVTKADISSGQEGLFCPSFSDISLHSALRTFLYTQ